MKDRLDVFEAATKYNAEGLMWKTLRRKHSSRRQNWFTIVPHIRGQTQDDTDERLVLPSAFRSTILRYKCRNLAS